MARPVLAAALLALCTGACSTEQHTTYVTAPPVSAGPVVEGVTPAQLMAESRAACDSYGLTRGTANYDRCVQNEFAARRPG
jgi:hypothetical protein